MSPYVFLSFRRCQKHPHTPPFNFGTRLPNLATFSAGEIGGDRYEIEWRFRGAQAE